MQISVASSKSRSEVRGIYLTTGENNLTLRVVVDSLEDLQRFTDTLHRDFRLKQNSSQMIVKVFKDDQAVLLRPRMKIVLKCETCNGSVAAKPFILRVAGHERFFCCPRCLEKFRERYESKLKTRELIVEAHEL